nr:iron-siderophore ABC transporter substrate-binding protein [Allorhizobium ampelinum]
MSADPFLSLSRRHLLAGGVSLFMASAARAQSAAPARVVCLDYGLASTLLAFGITPLAVASLADWDKWVEEPRMPDGVIDLGSSWEVNFELLIALKPDLILSTAFNDPLNPRLQALAPLFRASVYAPDTTDILTASYSATRDLGKVMRLEARAEAFLAEADAFFDACRARLARLNAPPVALVNFMDARHVRVYTAPGLYHDVLQRLGLTNAWTKPGNYWGFELIGIETLATITDPRARLIAFEPVPADVMPTLAKSPLWQALPMAKPERFAVLPSTLMFGMVVEAMRFARLLTDYLDSQA